MRHILAIFATLFIYSAPVQAQTVKALSYGTNGRFITGTNVLTFTNSISFAQGDFQITESGALNWSGADRIELETYTLYGPWTFDQPANVRTNLGLGATWLTNTNVTNFRTAIGLGATNIVQLEGVVANAIYSGTNTTNDIVLDTQNLTIYAQANQVFYWDTNFVNFNVPVQFNNTTNAAITRANLGLGATNIVTFAGLTNNGDITINQTTATNGLLYIRRTNNEPFLGLANLIASNNTTVSNETLFRVGVAEATNRSAQFGFRATNTNGNGVAVFSVFGFNALMQIGADASTNAVIYSGGGTNNEVMTLIRDGATEFARPLRFSTNAASKPATNAPANTTNVAAWVEMQIGTNSYRVPLYQ